MTEDTMARPDGQATDLTSPVGSREEPEVEDAFDRMVSEGHDRLTRPLLSLLSTGLLGGVDVGVGVLIYLVVKTDTGDALLASLAFTIGFVALLMARSELFTENFLVPVTAVVARQGRITELLRLWLVTLAANLAAGFAMAGMIVVALPDVRAAAISTGKHYAELGTSWRSFFLAVLAGAVITLLTRMQHSTDDLAVKIIPAVLMSFVLVGAPAVPFRAGFDRHVRRSAQRQRALRIRRLAVRAGVVGIRKPGRWLGASDVGATSSGPAPDPGKSISQLVT
jgi:formate/nitrite transporter FocA (FNT family)